MVLRLLHSMTDVSSSRRRIFPVIGVWLLLVLVLTVFAPKLAKLYNNTLAPGTSGWITEHLAPGTYVALSAVPDPTTGVFQLTQGLLTAFTVR